MDDIPQPFKLPEMQPTKLVDREFRRADVPCGKCTLCCRTLIVPLSIEEADSGQYTWAWITTRDGRRLGKALQRRPDGACVYLGEHGCTIHDRAPHVCQRFSCADLFVRSDRAGRRKAINSGKLPRSLFEKGHEIAKLMGLMK